MREWDGGVEKSEVGSGSSSSRKASYEEWTLRSFEGNMERFGHSRFQELDDDGAVFCHDVKGSVDVWQSQG